MVALARPADRLPLTNSAVAERLTAIADGLERPGGNPHRVLAYRTAAGVVAGLEKPVAEVLGDGGRAELEQLPGVGKRLSRVIEDLTLRGHAPTLEQQLGGPVAVLSSVSGIGPGLANTLHDRLGLNSLEDLERAAHDGRLAGVPGFGAKRVREVREALAGRFRRPTAGPVAETPPVADVLALDAAYRERAATGVLRQVAPRRFNPTAAAWLPVWKTHKGGRAYRLVFSNTPLAHRLNKVREWVVVYYSQDGASGQCTVTTATDGPLAGWCGGGKSSAHDITTRQTACSPDSASGQREPADGTHPAHAPASHTSRTFSSLTSTPPARSSAATATGVADGPIRSFDSITSRPRPAT